jgi:hypothetical protein
VASDSTFVERTNFSASPGPLKLERYYENLRSNNTVMLALSTSGGSRLAVSNPYTNSIPFGIGPFLFSPSGTEGGTYRYYAPNGTLGSPAFVYPNECSLVAVTFQTDQLHYAGIPLIFSVGNQTETLTLNG